MPDNSHEAGGVVPSDRWERVKELFESALPLGRDDRQAFLDDACGADAALRIQIEALLASDAEAARFLETPAQQVAHPTSTWAGEIRVVYGAAAEGMLSAQPDGR